jgi:hypothetical protein
MIKTRDADIPNRIGTLVLEYKDYDAFDSNTNSYGVWKPVEIVIE